MIYKPVQRTVVCPSNGPRGNEDARCAKQATPFSWFAVDRHEKRDEVMEKWCLQIEH